MAAQGKEISRKIIWTPRVTRETLAVADFLYESSTVQILIGGRQTEWRLAFKLDGEDGANGFFRLQLVSTDIESLDVRHSIKVYDDEGVYSSNEYMKAFSMHDHVSDVDVFYNYLSTSYESFSVICLMTIELPEETPKQADDFSCFLRMFEQKLFCDFQIKSSDGVIFDAHKVVLALRSRVFEAMLTSDTKEAREGSVTIEDFGSKIVQELIRYLYCRKVENLDEIAHILIHAADKYLLNDLKQICIESLVQHVTDENFVPILKICDHLSNTESLYNACLNFLTNNLQILNSDKWNQLTQSMQMKMLRCLAAASASSKDISVQDIA